MNGLFAPRRLAFSIHRSARVLHLGQRYGCFNQHWQSRFQPKQQNMNLTRSYGTLPDASKINKVIDAELARRGDFRRADELSDPEFNELYLQKFSHFETARPTKAKAKTKAKTKAKAKAKAKAKTKAKETKGAPIPAEPEKESSWTRFFIQYASRLLR